LGGKKTEKGKLASKGPLVRPKGNSGGEIKPLQSPPVGEREKSSSKMWGKATHQKSFKGGKISGRKKRWRSLELSPREKSKSGVTLQKEPILC